MGKDEHFLKELTDSFAPQAVGYQGKPPSIQLVWPTIKQVLNSALVDHLLCMSLTCV
jgi:hypothetical protein